MSELSADDKLHRLDGRDLLFKELQTWSAFAILYQLVNRFNQIVGPLNDSAQPAKGLKGIKYLNWKGESSATRISSELQF